MTVNTVSTWDKYLNMLTGEAFVFQALNDLGQAFTLKINHGEAASQGLLGVSETPLRHSGDVIKAQEQSIKVPRTPERELWLWNLGVGWECMF